MKTGLNSVRQQYARSFRKGSQANIKPGRAIVRKAVTPVRGHYGPPPTDCTWKTTGREACGCNECFDKLCAIAEVMGLEVDK